MSVLVNAFVCPAFPLRFELTSLSISWLPLDQLSHCLAHAECKLTILDADRADILQPIAAQLLQTSPITSFLVFDLSYPKKRNNFIPSLDAILDADDQVFLPKISIDPEDNATVIFTSGSLIILSFCHLY